MKLIVLAHIYSIFKPPPIITLVMALHIYGLFFFLRFFTGSSEMTPHFSFPYRPPVLPLTEGAMSLLAAIV